MVNISSVRKKKPPLSIFSIPYLDFVPPSKWFHSLLPSLEILLFNCGYFYVCPLPPSNSGGFAVELLESALAILLTQTGEALSWALRFLSRTTLPPYSPFQNTPHSQNPHCHKAVPLTHGCSYSIFSQHLAPATMIPPPQVPWKCLTYPNTSAGV